MLAVPFFAQTKLHTCLPACARMVLAFLGHTYTEETRAEAFQTVPFLGTQPDKMVSGLNGLGFQALWFEKTDLARLEAFLAESWPVIIFVRAQDLPHGRAGLHALALVSLTNNEAICLDPSISDKLVLERNHFAQIWGQLDRQGLVIWKNQIVTD